MMRARDLLVRTRTHMVAHVRGIPKAFGIRLPAWSASCFGRAMTATGPARHVVANTSLEEQQRIPTRRSIHTKSQSPIVKYQFSRKKIGA